ncbi:membrane protein [Cronobacter malonaticus ENBT0334]|nr:membrane protein [Cronobacter malonaticus ENBT0334]
MAFCAYFFIGLAMINCFMFIYTRITAHDEWKLIKENNSAAAITFGGAILGYVVPLASAAINSVSITDYLSWGAIALVVQLIIYGGVRLYMPKLSEKIIDRNVAAAIFMGVASLAGGILNAACMTW